MMRRYTRWLTRLLVRLGSEWTDARESIDWLMVDTREETAAAAAVRLNDRLRQAGERRLAGYGLRSLSSRGKDIVSGPCTGLDLPERVRRHALRPVIITTRRYASTVYAVVTCLSARPSHAGIVPKPLNVGSRKQRHTIAQGL